MTAFATPTIFKINDLSVTSSETPYVGFLMSTSIWAMMQGFPTKQDSNQCPQLQRLARKLKIHL